MAVSRSTAKRRFEPRASWQQTTRTILLPVENLGIDGRGIKFISCRRYPRLKITGSDGYYPAQCARERASRVRASGAKLLIVGMGTRGRKNLSTNTGKNS